MKLITYNMIGSKKENLKIIKNIKVIRIIPCDFYQTTIAYRLKDKKYESTEYEQEDVSILDEIEIK